MSGIESWVSMEEPELLSVAEMVVNEGHGVMTVQVLSRHDVDTFDVNMLYPGLDVDLRVVPMGDLRPVSTGQVAVVEDDGQGGETWTSFRTPDAAVAYSRTVDRAVHIEGLTGAYVDDGSYAVA